MILISSMHHNKEINEEKKNPVIICFYNSIKCGMNILDMKCAVYTSNWRTRCWPLAVFHRLLNIASSNSFILYLCYLETPAIKRFQFIKDLAHTLVEPHLQRRFQIPNLRREVKFCIAKILALNEDQPVHPEGIPCDKMAKKRYAESVPLSRKEKPSTSVSDAPTIFAWSAAKKYV